LIESYGEEPFTRDVPHKFEPGVVKPGKSMKEKYEVGTREAGGNGLKGQSVDLKIQIIETQNGPRLTAMTMPLAQPIGTTLNAASLARASINTGIFAAWPSGQLGCGSISSMM